MITCGLRPPSTESGIDKGCEGASFHSYHTAIIFTHLFLLMVLIELDDAGVLVGGCVGMEYSNNEESPLKSTPEPS